MTRVTTALRPRNCVLDEETHKYFFDPDGKNIEMAISVTGVIAAGKPPVDYSKYPEAAPRGTHVHRCMEALATGSAMPPTTSPEGIDCSEWFQVLQELPLWGQCDVLATEYTMTKSRWSLGGQLDLLVRKDDRTILIDLKTKSRNWELPKPKSRWYASWEQTVYGYAPRPVPMPICWRPAINANPAGSTNPARSSLPHRITYGCRQWTPTSVRTPGPTPGAPI